MRCQHRCWSVGIDSVVREGDSRYRLPSVFTSSFGCRSSRWDDESCLAHISVLLALTDLSARLDRVGLFQHESLFARVVLFFFCSAL